MTINEMGEILQNEVNSAMLTFANHSNDNSFIDDDIKSFIQNLGNIYEPIGICKNVPFSPLYEEYAIAFCFKVNEELYWIHLPENLYLTLLRDIYGRQDGYNIFCTIMGY